MAASKAIHRPFILRSIPATGSTKMFSVIKGRGMRMTFLPATLIVLTAITPALIRGQKGQKDIVGVMPGQVQWFTPPYYTDGRQRARLYGDSNQGGCGSTASIYWRESMSPLTLTHRTSWLQ